MKVVVMTLPPSDFLFSNQLSKYLSESIIRIDRSFIARFYAAPAIDNLINRENDSKQSSIIKVK